LVVAPTGYGKTVVMGAVADEEIRRGGRVLAVVNLQVLLGQTVNTMQDGFGIPSSALHDKITHYLQGDRNVPLVLDYQRRLLVTMPQTLTNTMGQGGRTNDLYLDPNFEPTMILLDEAHKATSAEFQKIKARWPRAKIVGFTATPYREKSDVGESLEEWYGDRMIIAATIGELIETGRLARPIYNEVGEQHVAQTWLHAVEGHENRRTIVFTDDTDHSMKMVQQFQDLGIRAEVVTSGKGLEGQDDYVARQSPKDRNDIFARFHGGQTEVLISVNALCEGFDEKLAKFCFLTRRVGNIAFYQQMVGRVLRWMADKPYGYIWDFAGNIKEHGPVEAIEWPRASKGLLLEQEEREICAKSFAKSANVWKSCDSCGHVYNIKASKSCKVCGEAHLVSLTSTIADIVTEYLDMDHKTFQTMSAKIRMAINNPSIQDMVNRQVQRPLFQDGQLAKPYSFMKELIMVYEMNKIRKGTTYVGDWQASISLAA
jgi:superfamily II DNA or RNA helicase